MLLALAENAIVKPAVSVCETDSPWTARSKRALSSFMCFISFLFPTSCLMTLIVLHKLACRHTGGVRERSHTNSPPPKAVLLWAVPFLSLLIPAVVFSTVRCFSSLTQYKLISSSWGASTWGGRRRVFCRFPWEIKHCYNKIKIKKKPCKRGKKVCLTYLQ